MFKKSLGVIAGVFLFSFSILANVVPLDSSKGEEMLLRSEDPAYYVPLMSQFVTQEHLVYCGIASTVMVLNALHVEAPDDPIYHPYKIFTQKNIFTPEVLKIVTPRWILDKGGTNMYQLKSIFAEFGVEAEINTADNFSADDFRTEARDVIENQSGYIIVNYVPDIFGQPGGGHFSPLGAYDEKTDRFLIFDVQRYKYPPVWVKTDELWNSMYTTYGNGKYYRGYLLVKTPEDDDSSDE